MILKTNTFNFAPLIVNYFESAYQFHPFPLKESCVLSMSLTILRRKIWILLKSCNLNNNITLVREFGFFQLFFFSDFEISVHALQCVTLIKSLLKCDTKFNQLLKYLLIFLQLLIFCCCHVDTNVDDANQSLNQLIVVSIEFCLVSKLSNFS